MISHRCRQVVDLVVERWLKYVFYLFLKIRLLIFITVIYMSCYNVLWILTLCMNWEYFFCCGVLNTWPTEFRKLISVKQCFLQCDFFLILSLQQKWKEVAQDCTKAVELNPKYVKALFRRAKAHEKLDNKKECLEGEGIFVFMYENY